MTLTIHNDIEQGSDAWLELRRGIITASVVGQLITSRAPDASAYPCPECGADANTPCVSRSRKEPTPIKTLHASRVAPADAPRVLEVSSGEVARGLMTTLVAERITGWIEPVYVSDDMMRGRMDEPLARDLYSRTHAPATEVGFMVADSWGFKIGYSPDGLVGDDGLIEVKSRKPKKHLATILENTVPAENMAQIQAGLLVSGREWCDYLSYCGGMPMFTKRVYPDQQWFDAIIAAVETFERVADEMEATYNDRIDGLPTTERIDYYQEIRI